MSDPKYIKIIKFSSEDVFDHTSLAAKIEEVCGESYGKWTPFHIDIDFQSVTIVYFRKTDMEKAGSVWSGDPGMM